MHLSSPLASHYYTSNFTSYPSRGDCCRIKQKQKHIKSTVHETDEQIIQFLLIDICNT